MVNLVIVMFLGGLWHGAAWTFVVWGLLHGSYLAIERLLKAFVRPPRWIDHFLAQFSIGLVTYFAVLVAWVYFRAANFESASRVIAGMFGQHARPDAILSTREILQVALVTLGLLTAHWIMRDTSIEAIVTRLPRWSVGAVWFLMAGAIIITQGSSNAFIYFQF
jgi:D-alanyl-lipoteichoic acid acyltransferase DltB (MBOAT superfamily)